MRIVFIMRTNTEFFRLAANCARANAPGVGITLIGPPGIPYHGLCDEFVPIDSLKTVESEEVAQFYTHLSPHSHEFSLFDILRWMYLHEYVRWKRQPEDLLVIDHDVLIFSNPITAAQPYLNGVDYCLSHLRSAGTLLLAGRSVSPAGGLGHPALHAYSLMVREAYVGRSNPKLWAELFGHTPYEQTGEGEGMSDMHLWRKLLVRHPEIRVGDTSTVINGGFWDHNLGFAENGVVMCDNGLKYFDFVGGVPWALVQDGPPLRLHSLHCWGLGKRMMPRYYRQSLAQRLGIE